MLQQTPYLLLTRPLTFFGTFEQFEQEMYQEEEFFDVDEFSQQFGCLADANQVRAFDQKIGLFIHWFDLKIP